MKVRFKYTWFAPTEKVKRDRIQVISGRRFKRGVQEVPEEFRDILPKSAEILDDDYKSVVPEKQREMTLKEVDDVRAALDAETAAHEKAQVQYDRMAKMREAKKRKAEERRKAENG